MVLEPRVGRDLFGALDVAVVEVDLDIVGEFAAVVVHGADAHELGVGDGQAFGLEGQGDRALLDDRVDVVPPGVAVEQAVDGQVVLLVEAVEQAADAAGGLAGALGEDAVVLFPEAVLVEALPDGVLFDVQDEVGLDVLELEDVGLADGGDAVAAGAHASAVDLVAVVDDGDVADHGAALLGEDMEFLAERAEGDLEVFEDGVGLGLVVEGFFLGALDGVQAGVEHAAEAGGLVLLDEVDDPVGVDQGLHELAGLAEVEELAGVGGVAHAEDAGLLVPLGVGRGPGGDLEGGLDIGEGGGDHAVGEAVDAPGGVLVAGGAVGGFGAGGVVGRGGALVEAPPAAGLPAAFLEVFLPEGALVDLVVFLAMGGLLVLGGTGVPPVFREAAMGWAGAVLLGRFLAGAACRSFVSEEGGGGGLAGAFLGDLFDDFLFLGVRRVGFGL